MLKRKTLFPLLQISVGRRSAFDVAPTQEEWEELFSFCFANGLAALGFKGIERMPKEQRPCMRQMLQWTGQAEIVRKQNEKAARLSEKVCRILQRHGLHAQILKGQSMAKLYDYPEVRACGDIDVWCVPVGFEDAPLSVRRKEVIRLLRGYMKPSELKSVVYHHMDFTSIEDVRVEVHFTPSWFFNPLYNWRFQEEVGAPNPLTPLPQFGERGEYILLHIYRHLFAEGANLKQLTDYYFVLKDTYENDKRSVIEKREMLRYFGLEKFAGAVEYCLLQIFDMPEEWLIAPVQVKAGRMLLEDVLNYSPDNILKDGTWKKFFTYTRHACRYLRFYPNEVLWMPFFKIYQLVWRKSS